MPTISVIIPVYRSEQYLHRCIDSVLSQTFRNLELILVNDGSPDSSGLICNHYSTLDNRIQVIHQTNRGVSAARNTGLAVAKGKYILFVDSDDYLDSEFVSQLFSQKSDLTICGIETRDESGNFLYTSHYAPVHYSQKKDIDFPLLYKDLLLYSPYCKLFRRDIIEQNSLRFNTNITWGEDGMFVADYLQHIQSLNVIEYTGYYYIKYTGDQTLSTKVRENIVEMVIAAREYCIQKMRNTSPQHYESVRNICTDDLQWNCVYFVTKLLKNMSIKKREKLQILHTFCNSSHIIYTLQHPEKYYSSMTELHTALKTADPRKIIRKQCKVAHKNRTRTILYRFYRVLPHFVKSIYIKTMRKV